MNQKVITNYFNAQKPTDRLEKPVDHVSKRTRRMTTIPDFFKPLQKDAEDENSNVEQDVNLLAPTELESESSYVVASIEITAENKIDHVLSNEHQIGDVPLDTRATNEMQPTIEASNTETRKPKVIDLCGSDELGIPLESKNNNSGSHILSENESKGKQDDANTITAAETNSKKRSYDEMDTNIAPLLIDITPKTFQTIKAKEPAFRRFAGLVNSKTVTLPKQYANLLKRFDALETIMNYLQSRGETCIFHKIKRSVEMQSELSFELNNLGQIMYIYPSAYKLSPITIKFKEETVNSLSIEFVEDLLSEQFVSRLKKESQPLTSGAKLSNSVNAVNNSNLMSAVKEFTQQYKNRRVVFQNTLIQRVSDCHKKFLLENNLQWEYNPLKPTFHPLFKIEDVDGIPSAELPLKKPISYVDQLKIKHGILEGKKPEQVELKKETQEVLTITDEKKPVSRAKALLERVRARQQQKANQPDQKENIEYEKRKSMLTRLPMIASSLQLHVKALKKSIIPVPAAINHLIRSFSDVFLKPDEWYEHIKLLVEIVPTFCTLELQIGAKTTGLESYLVRFHDGRMKQVREMVEELKKK
ncbi:replication licensing factor Cdt1 [Boothiomyces sp. JEL0866]|nr:replication licensing factor Cdt1 [Boothiomyces sp. JEL0866]KAJ3325722.1 replication licensing factor Cdt1 [Boothiomyces sp. JEL0866]